MTTKFYTVVIFIACMGEFTNKFIYNKQTNSTELWAFFMTLILVDILRELRRK